MGGIDWRALAPALLLLAVAGRQIYLARTALLSPWKGGGFGMFASTDGGDWRALRIWIEGPGRDEEILVPRSIRELADKARALPGEHRLEAVARAVAARERRAEREVTGVRLQVTGTVFDPVTLLATTRTLRRYRHDVPPRAP